MQFHELNHKNPPHWIILIINAQLTLGDVLFS